MIRQLKEHRNTQCLSILLAFSIKGNDPQAVKNKENSSKKKLKAKIGAVVEITKLP